MFEPKTTALVLIDLQKGILARQGAPYSSSEVLTKCTHLADRFREAGATIVHVRVDIRQIQNLPVDEPMRPPGSPEPPESASELVLARGEKDLVITKHQWGAFYGTALDQQLRRRGIKTIILAGIATNFGVESTGRDAQERGYEIVFVEDAMTTVSAEHHEFATKHIFPRLGRVRSSEKVLEVLA